MTGLPSDMAEVESMEEPSPEELLSALARTTSDNSGVETFARYLWQAKQAVRLWLTCLSLESGPVYVICEKVEDITLIYHARVRFLQLKTKDRGSWSAKAMCDEGLDSLLRSYLQARETGLHSLATFELWLEGPVASTTETLVFVTDPTRASTAVREKLLGNGGEPEWLDDFLGRLVINAKQPSQGHIDAVAIREIACLWPSLSKDELDTLYRELLQAATDAQAAQCMPSRHLQVAAALDESSGQAVWDPEAIAWDPLRPQILSREAVMTLCPPLPGESLSQILARMEQGTAASLMELKMTIAGAREETISEVQAFRAEMEVQRQVILASQQDPESSLERLARRVLTMANATARTIQLASVTNPVAASRPAEAIAVQLLSRPSELGNLDNERLFHGDGLLLYGFLGHLSDLCRYSWRSL
jgi:hypothetical protein